MHSYKHCIFMVSSFKQCHCAHITKYINIKNNSNSMSKSSLLHFVVSNTWSKHHGYSCHFYYANLHSCYNTEPELTTLIKHSHTDWHINTLTLIHYSALYFYASIENYIAFAMPTSWWSQVDWPLQNFTCQKCILTFMILSICIASIKCCICVYYDSV